MEIECRLNAVEVALKRHKNIFTMLLPTMIMILFGLLDLSDAGKCTLS